MFHFFTLGAYLGPYQTPMMGFFANLVNGYKSVTSFAKKTLSKMLDRVLNTLLWTKELKTNYDHFKL